MGDTPSKGDPREHAQQRRGTSITLDRFVGVMKEIRKPYFEHWRWGNCEERQIEMPLARRRLASTVVRLDLSSCPDHFYWNQITLYIHRGIGLLAKDKHIGGTNMSDPYVRVLFYDDKGNEVLRRISPYFQMQLDPVWNWDLTTTWGAETKEELPKIDRIVVQVKDIDDMSSDDFMGEFSMDLKDMDGEFWREREVPLENEESKEGQPDKHEGERGSLVVSIGYERKKMSKKQFKKAMKRLQEGWKIQIDEAAESVMDGSVDGMPDQDDNHHNYTTTTTTTTTTTPTTTTYNNNNNNNNGQDHKEQP